MIINITTRHIELTPRLRSYVYKKLEKAKKYFNHLVSAQLILNAEKYGHVAEVFIQASGSNIMAKEQAGDIYSAVDKVMDKVAKQLKKYKEKLKEHKHQKNKISSEEIPEESYGETSKKSGVVLKKKSIKLKSMSVKEAILSIKSKDNTFCVFINSDTKEINILHQRQDNVYEIIEPQM